MPEDAVKWMNKIMYGHLMDWMNVHCGTMLMDEEMTEYQADKSIEEMADVLEVLFTICVARGYSVDELMRVRKEKCEKRGGFKDRVYWVG